MKVLRLLLIVQFAGVAIAAIAAWIEIETIIVSGSLLSINGLLIVPLAYKRDWAGGLYLGLATSAMALFCFVLIYQLRLGPNDAQQPVSMLISWFAALYLMCGFPVALSLPSVEPARSGSPRLQFTIAHLLLLTTGVAVPIGLGRLLGWDAVVVTMVVGYVVFVAVLLQRFYRRRTVAALGTKEGMEPQMDADQHG